MKNEAGDLVIAPRADGLQHTKVNVLREHTAAGSVCRGPGDCVSPFFLSICLCSVVLPFHLQASILLKRMLFLIM